MNLKTVLENLGVDTKTYTSLRSYLIEKNDIYFLTPGIRSIEGFENELKEINEITEKLEEYIWNEFEEVDFDYHENTEQGCYFLSILFSLTSSWDLVQGKRIDALGENYYHSWCEKEGLVYDPSLRVVTLKNKYEKFFIPENKYTKEETQELLKQTGHFTHFKYDLEEGLINPLASYLYYRTPQAKESGTRMLEALDKYVGLKEDNYQK